MAELTWDLLDEKVRKDIKRLGCVRDVKRILNSNVENKIDLIRECVERKRNKMNEYKKEYNDEYYQNNKDKILEQHKEWRENNREKISEQHKEWRENNREKISEYKKKYNKNNKDKISEKHKELYESDMKECREYLGVYCYILGVEFLYDKPCDIHHINQITKSFGVASNHYLIRTDPERMKLELNKCVLLHPTIHQPLVHNELDEIKVLMGLDPKKDFLPYRLYHEHWNEFVRRYKGKTEKEINRLCDSPIEEKYQFVKELNKINE